MPTTARRIERRDVVIAALVGIVAFGDMVFSHLTPDLGEPSLLAAPVFALVAVPLLWRRVAPLHATLGALAVLLVHVALFGELVRCGIIYPVGFLLAFAAASQLPLRAGLAGLVLVWLLGVAVSVTELPSGADLASMAFIGPVTAAVWGIGRLTRTRTEMVDELAARTGELRAARDERARMEIATDRARMSAQLDELLQRRLRELAELAEAGAADADPAAALSDIEARSRRTLEEMRAVVGVLRSDEERAPLAPQPGLLHLDALLMRAKGTAARLTVEGNPRALPAGVDLSAYRVLEHLLDALEGDDEVHVRVSFADDALELAVSGPARRRAEQAFARARERVQLHGGTLRVNTQRGHADAVVSLPVYAPV